MLPTIFPTNKPASELLAQARKLLEDRDLPQAIQSFYQAEQDGAYRCACAAGRWNALMLMGDFDAAWRESDMLRVLDPDDQHRLWRGEPIAGKRLIVRCLRGLGDAIQFLRYAPLLRKVVKQLIVQVPPTLLPLAMCIPGIDHVITWDELSTEPAPEWNVQLEIMQLPYLFRTTLQSIPTSVPYLQLPADELSGAAAAMDDLSYLPRIGLCWSCGKWNPSRGMTPQLLQTMVRNTPAHYFSLEQEPSETLIHFLHPEATWSESSDFGSGPLRLAAIISQLDLVITVDTMAAHIAGAMGKPVWLMLQYAADWRWMHHRSDSPWYPTMRIFRQPQPGDWENILEEVSHQLEAFTKQPATLNEDVYARLG